MNKVVMGSSPVAVTEISYLGLLSSKEFLEIQSTVEYWFTLKGVRHMIRTYNQMHGTDKYSQHISIIWPARLNSWLFIYELSSCGIEASCRYLNFGLRTSFEKGVPLHYIQSTVECEFTLKRARDMTRRYSQMHRTNKYSQHRSINFPVLFKPGVFAHELSGSRFKSSCSHLNLRFPDFFEEGVLWDSGNYKVWINFKTTMWYDKNIESNAPYR